MASVRQEKESLTQQLLNTIKHKVALSQELDAWQVSVCRQVEKGDADMVTGFIWKNGTNGSLKGSVRLNIITNPNRDDIISTRGIVSVQLRRKT